MLHLAADTQCWASHCLHLRDAEEKQRRGRTRAQKNESASALQLLKSKANIWCLYFQPILHIRSLFFFPILFLTTGLVVPAPPVFPGAPGLWYRALRSFPGLPGLFPISRPVSRPGLFAPGFPYFLPKCPEQVIGDPFRCYASQPGGTLYIM